MYADPPPTNTADLLHGAACGIVMTLLAASEDRRDMALSQVGCEAALASILIDDSAKPDSTVAGAANTLRVLFVDADAQHHPASRHFTKAETSLMFEWLARFTKPLQ